MSKSMKKLIDFPKDYVPTTEEFDIFTKEYRENLKISENAANYAKKKLAPLIQNYIKKFGEQQKDSFIPEDKVIIWEDQKWCHRGARRSSTAAKEAIDYCSENDLDAVEVTVSMSLDDYKKLYSQSSLVRDGKLKSLDTKTILNKDSFQRLFEAGEIPQHIVDSANKTTLTYKLYCYDISEKICKKCGNKIKTADNFCPACGKKLTKAK